MKKFIKILGLLILFCIFISYLSFVFVLPKVVDLNKYKPLIQEVAKEQAKLDVDFVNAQIITTPLLGLGVKIDDLSVNLPDNTTLFYSSAIKTRVALPSLLLLTVKVSCFEVENPFLNLEIADNQNMKIVKLVEEIINENKQKQMGKVKTTDSQFNAEIIRIKVPNFKLKNYQILVNDIKAKHYLSLQGKELSLGYFNGKTAKLKGDAELFSDENKNISAKLDINTFLPKVEPSLDAEDDDAKRIEINISNPVTMYRKYDLKTDIDTKIRISSKKGEINSFGHLNIDSLTLKVLNVSIPKSYLHAKTFGNKITLDTDLNISDNTKINLLGNIKYGKHPKTDINVKTGKIYFQDLINLAQAFLDSLDIKHELNTIRANGYFEADTYIKTNFKKLKSNGFVRIKDGGLNIKNIGNVISDANINILLDNSILDVKNSKINLGGANISIDGSIDNSSNADIKIKSEDISLPIIFKAFAPKDLKNNYNLEAGKTKFNALIKGKLKEAVADVSFQLTDFSFSDIKKSFNISDKILEGKILADSRTLSAGLENADFVVRLPQTKSSISIPKLNLKISEGNLTVDENKIYVNEKSYLTYMANIVNYQKPKSLLCTLKGNLNTNDLIKILGTENAKFFDYAGEIPLNLSISGNHKKQSLLFEILGDEKNHITPFLFDKISGLPYSIQTKIDFKPNRIKIKDTGFFTRNIVTDENGNEKVHLKEIFGIDGTVAGDTINLIKLNVPHPLTGRIYLFPNSSFKIDRSRIFVFGKTYNPRIRGRFKINDVNIPELLLGLRELDMKLDGINSDLSIKNLSLNGSEINIETLFKTLQSSTFELAKLSVNSNSIDVDNAMKVADSAAKYFPADNSSSKQQTAQPADIPLKISNGKIDIKHLKTGNINIYDILSDLLLDNNILYINNLTAKAFDGSVSGDISTDLITSLLNIKMSGNGVDVDKAMVDAAGIKNTLSGKTDFTVNISLKGSTYEEQMKSLQGGVAFHAKDGQYGPFGKIENLIIAENIRESEIFKSALGGVISKLTTIDTTHYNDLSGVITFKDGICKIEEITSAGDVLMLHIFGEFNLLQNTIDMKVRAKMTSVISQVLGPIGAVNPIQLLNSAAGTNIVTAKAFSMFCETLTEDEINTIPSFPNKYVDTAANANRFQLVAQGDVSKPLSLIKSFKWITTKLDFDKASELIASLPEQQEGSTAQTIEELIAENAALEKEKKTLKYKITHLFSRKKKKNKENSAIIPVSDNEKNEVKEDTGVKEETTDTSEKVTDKAETEIKE